MPNSQITAEVRLYRWLKRKTTPPDAWKTLSFYQLAKKARCSKSMVSRKLPKVVAKLNGISLDEAEKLVDDVMNVRRCRLLDWEIEILKELRKKDPPVSMFRLSFIFGVSKKNISDICNALGIGRERGIGYFYWGISDTQILEGFHHRIPEIEQNVEIRSQLRETHRRAYTPAHRDHFFDFWGTKWI